MRQVAAPPHLERTMSALGDRLQIQRKERKRERKIRWTASQKTPRVKKPAITIIKHPETTQQQYSTGDHLSNKAESKPPPNMK